MFEGESKDPQAVADAIKAEIARLKKDGIDKEQFETVRRALYGKEIMSYNDIDSVANSFIACDFNEWDIFEAMDIYRNVTAEDIQNRLNSMMSEDKSALSVVKNKDE